MGQENVFWRGTDANLLGMHWDKSGWSAAANNGTGPLGSSASVAVWPGNKTAYTPGQQDAFWKGNANSNALVEAYWNNGWHGPCGINVGQHHSVGAFGHGQPGPNQGENFWRGTNSNLWEIYWDRGGWHGPVENGDGPLGSGPSAAVWPNGQQDVFWRANGTRHLVEVSWKNGGWTPYKAVRGVTNMASAPQRSSTPH